MLVCLLRSVILYLLLILVIRLMGKRQIGEMEPSEFVVTMLIADLASVPMQDLGIPLLSGVIPILTVLSIEVLFSALAYHFIPVRKLLCGKPSMLVINGEVNQQEMKKNRFTLDELAEELRNQSITDISKIQYAILETDGRLNTILFPAEQPLTPAQMHITVEDPGYPTILINDGKLIAANLQRVGRDARWLEKELRSRGAGSPAEVYLFTLNKAGQIYYAAKEKKK